VAPEFLQDVTDLYPKSTGERIAEFAGIRTKRGWGGLSARDQNLMFQKKQFMRKLRDYTDDLDRKMDIAFENGDYERLGALAALRYADPRRGLQEFMKRKRYPVQYGMQQIPKRYRAQFAKQVYGK
jgi:hypothetical protein